MPNQMPRHARLAALSVILMIPVSGPALAGLTGVCRDDRDLITSYLRCEAAARQDRLSAGEIRRCSEIYYALKAQVFDDDFMRIRAWYDRVRAAPADPEVFARSQVPSAGSPCPG